MNFFKSILSDDTDPPKSENDQESDAISLDVDRNSNDVANGWSFGDLIKTLTVQSESVIETYRRDLKEFGLGLRKESGIFRETASRAVKDLPASLEATASAAHGALDGVLKSTAEIIAKESLVFAKDREPETPETNRSFASGRYSRFHAKLSAIQNDLNTYIEEPGNVEEYGKWKSGFELEDYKDEFEYMIGENGMLENVYKKVVPKEVDHETFWCRYFYRVDKLKQQERVRANLVKRAISVDDDDDELTWDFDDEENGNGGDLVSNPKVKEGEGLGKNVRSHDDSIAGENAEDLNGELKDVKEGCGDNLDDLGKEGSFDGDREAMSEEAAKGKSEEEVESEESVDGKRVEGKAKSEEGVKEKNEGMEGVKEEGTSVVLSHPMEKEEEEEEDMEWDEIGDNGSDDDKKTKGSNGGSRNKGELQKQLSAMEDEDEDLNWDIEEDDEKTVKKA